MKKILFAVLCVFMLASCSFYHETPIGDQRFDGNFFYYKKTYNENTFERSEIGILWYFDGSSKALKTAVSEGYSKTQGFYYYDLQEWFEVETKDNKYFRERLWDNEFDDWSDWLEYEFLEDGTLRFFDKYGYKDYER